MSTLLYQLPEWLENCLGEPVAILGAGKSGRGAKALIEMLGGNAFLYDQAFRSDGSKDFDRKVAQSVGLVVYSPGFKMDHEWIGLARAEGCRVIPEFDLGAALWKGPMIAVTGTNGKTTLTSFLKEAFLHIGIESHALGNIGNPICELLAGGCNPEAMAVCEISSFQAETLELFQADHVLWTNFDEDHLDRHESMPVYFRSKYRLITNAREQSVFIDRSVYDFGKQIGLDMPASSVVEKNCDIEGLGLRGSVFETEPELNTYLMARSLWLSLGLSERDLVEACHLFKKAPHRMEFVGEKEGVRFWNDSKATNFHAVIGGLNRFEKPVLWLGGGKSKGGEIVKFASQLSLRIKAAALFGQTRFQLEKALDEAGCEASVHESLENAVVKAFEIAETGDNILLSPGFASFDMFENYQERGEAFRKAVDCL